MRFFVIWLDGEGFAQYAEHFEHPTFPQAARFIAHKFIRQETIDPGVSGYLITYADSEFLRRYTVAPGSVARRKTDRCELELACRDFPHLFRNAEVHR